MSTKEHLKRARRTHRTYGTQATEGAIGGEAFLDKVAVGKLLGVGPRTVSEWAKEGRLPAYRIGPYLRFKWTEVEAHLAATCQLKTKAESRKQKAEIFGARREEKEEGRERIHRAESPVLRQAECLPLRGTEQREGLR